ncbi:hypothetical protein HMPREF1862_00671 [Varibaculum cambriense]|uniref:Uncharacterized protein n=1 Tax=Varibaculum cambriense TaxID=184870 RepID=A0AB34WZK2_9ACTO|nr:hypothetical protein HMPREF1862_00671 [Varibaculum cambriense]
MVNYLKIFIFYFSSSHHYLEFSGLLSKNAAYKGFELVNWWLDFWGWF